MANLLFYLVSLGAVVGSIGVVSSKNPIASVLSLLVTFFCLATIYLLAGFQFLAAAQILVYAGAIMVLFLFVIMLLNLGETPRRFLERTVLRTRKLPVALGIGTLLVVLTVIAVLSSGNEAAAAEGVAPPDTIAGIAKELFGSYLLPFEAASVLLLAGAVAVMVLAKREGRTGPEEGTR